MITFPAAGTDNNLHTRAHSTLALHTLYTHSSTHASIELLVVFNGPLPGYRRSVVRSLTRSLAHSLTHSPTQFDSDNSHSESMAFILFSYAKAVPLIHFIMESTLRRY